MFSPSFAQQLPQTEFEGPAASSSRPLPDLEQPLLPAGEEEEHTYMEHMLEPKPWPQLRLSSVSTRRLSPAMFSSPADELLTGRAGSGDSGTPSQQRSRAVVHLSPSQQRSRAAVPPLFQPAAQSSSRPSLSNFIYDLCYYSAINIYFCARSVVIAPLYCILNSFIDELL